MTQKVAGPPFVHPKFRTIALSIYCGVFVIGLLDWLVERPPPVVLRVSSEAALALFCSSVGTLILLEWLRTRVNFLQSTRRGYIYLSVKILLSGIAIGVSDNDYSQLLFLIAILFAELIFSRKVSLITIAVCFLLLFLRQAFGPRGDFISNNDALTLTVFSVLMVLILLMAQLIKDESAQRLDLESLNSELAESKQQIEQNAHQLAEMAVVNERNRMAREIHDSLGHHLAAVSIQLEMAEKLHKPEPAASLTAIQEAKSATQQALKDVRHSVHTLRESEAFELTSEVDLLIQRFATDELNIGCKVEGDESTASRPIRLALYRAIQEGLTNIHKHADASQVNLWLQFGAQANHLRIIDDGQGFDLTTDSQGTGLQGLHERIKALGGRVQIDSRLGEGTVLDITIPQVSV
ncbi:MAG: sensor histidine kinase [Chloroflexota bacterium]